MLETARKIDWNHQKDMIAEAKLTFDPKRVLGSREVLRETGSGKWIYRSRNVLLDL
jgi:hypothetical protein